MVKDYTELPWLEIGKPRSFRADEEIGKLREQKCRLICVGTIQRFMDGAEKALVSFENKRLLNELFFIDEFKEPMKAIMQAEALDSWPPVVLRVEGNAIITTRGVFQICFVHSADDTMPRISMDGMHAVTKGVLRGLALQVNEQNGRVVHPLTAAALDDRLATYVASGSSPWWRRILNWFAPERGKTP